MVAVNHVTNRLVEATLELIAKPFGRFYRRRIGDQNPFRPHQEHARVHVILVAIQGVCNWRDFLDDRLLSETAHRDDAEEKKCQQGTTHGDHPGVARSDVPVNLAIAAPDCSGPMVRYPPSTLSSPPVMKLASSEHRNRTPRATSLARPN